MNKYTAMVQCKSISPIGLPLYATVEFGLPTSEKVSVVIYSTCADFELNKEYLITVRAL